MSPTTCRVCGAQGPFKPYRAREMQFGTREEFDYIECETCSSVQIVDIPSPTELARHYPDAYYSFTAPAGRIRPWLFKQVDRHSAGKRTFFGAAYAKRRPDTTLPLLLKAGLKPNQRIVDIGSGRGQLLDRLARLGFTNLLGADPFISADFTTDLGVQIKKVSVNELEGQFDVIMFNHSLEHVPDPQADLAAAASHLTAGGLCIVRLPTPDSVGWAEHGTNWSSLDPPRHLVLPSRGGMTAMAARAGFDHVVTTDDSHADQYLLSELYSRDIAAPDPAAATAFTPADRARFKAVADQANRESRGDQAMFVFSLSQAAAASR